MVFAIPNLLAVNAALKQLKTGGKLTKLGMGLIGETFKILSEKLVTRTGMKRYVAGVIAGMVNQIVKTIFDISIGGIIIFALKRIFKTEKRKEKKYRYFGPVENIEYIIF